MNDHKICRECQSEAVCSLMGCRPLEVQFVGPEDYPTPNGVISALSAVIGGLALFFVGGGIGWVVWQVWPILRAVS